MGTRNLTMVFKDGKYVVAQYGQWDGYPDGQGLNALTFLRDQLDREKFFDGLSRICEPDQRLIDRINAHIERGGRVSDICPSLSRDTCAKILGVIQESTGPIPLRLDVDYAGDSLSCEWIWLADFDKGTFEALKGFNTKPLDAGERFANTPIDPDGHTYKDGDGEPYRYHQCKFVTSWPLDNLPDDETFLAAFRSPDDEEE
jgi:hypothetical protein